MSVVIAGEWADSEYITIDETGWHCADDAPDEIKDAYNDFMASVGTRSKLIEPKAKRQK